MPDSVSTVQPMTYLTQVQSTSPTRRFVAVTESFILLEKYGKIHLRAHMVLSKTWSCNLIPPCTIVMTSSMYQSIWVSMYRVCGRPSTVFGILEMVLYLVTGSEVLKMALATSISVSEKVQKNLNESIHTVVSTISMQMMIQSLLASNGNTQAKAPT